jgi:hypothetical protein
MITPAMTAQIMTWVFRMHSSQACTWSNPHAQALLIFDIISPATLHHNPDSLDNCLVGLVELERQRVTSDGRCDVTLSRRVTYYETRIYWTASMSWVPAKRSVLVFAQSMLLTCHISFSVHASFTTVEDTLLMKYIATYNPAKKYRFGNALYKHLESNMSFSHVHLVKQF